MPVLIRGRFGTEDTAELDYRTNRVGLAGCLRGGKPVLAAVRALVDNTNTRLHRMPLAENVLVHREFPQGVPVLGVGMPAFNLFKPTAHSNVLCYNGQERQSNGIAWPQWVQEFYRQYPNLYVPDAVAPRADGDSNCINELAIRRTMSIINHLITNAPGYVRRLVYAHAQLWGDRWEERGPRQWRRKVVSDGTELCKWVMSRILGTAPPRGVTLPPPGSPRRVAAEEMVEHVRVKIMGLGLVPVGQEASPGEQVTGPSRATTSWSSCSYTWPGACASLAQRRSRCCRWAMLQAPGLSQLTNTSRTACKPGPSLCVCSACVALPLHRRSPLRRMQQPVKHGYSNPTDT
jgi:hypothetical protein